MIIISKTKSDRRGLLNDWDLARKIEEVKVGGAKQHERTVSFVHFSCPLTNMPFAGDLVFHVCSIVVKSAQAS